MDLAGLAFCTCFYTQWLNTHKDTKTIHRFKINIKISLFWLPQRVTQKLLFPLGVEVQTGKSKSVQLNLCPLSKHVDKNKMGARFTAWITHLWQGGGGGQRQRLYRSLLARLGGTAAADAQVVGDVLDRALKRNDDVVQETVEGVDVICIQVLVDVVERDGHHNNKQEIHQKSEDSSSSRCLLGGDRAAPSGERLRVRAALGQDRALNSGLVQPVITWFQRSASCPADGTPAGCAVQDNKRQLDFFVLTHSGPHLSVLCRNMRRSEHRSVV